MQVKQTPQWYRCEWASYILAGLSLFMVLKAGLLMALFSGLLIYALVHTLTPRISKIFKHKRPRMLAVVFLSILFISTLMLMVWGAYAFFRSDAGNLTNLLQKMADIVEESRAQLPMWVSANIPEDVTVLKELLIRWLREHASEAKHILPQVGHGMVHLILGMVIGSMIAMYEVKDESDEKPLAKALINRLQNLASMFHRIVFAQVQISLINTIFTAIFLAVVLPLSGVHLPLIKSMILITFLAGLIPVVGNIVSNTVIVIVALSHSIEVAAGSLLFMVLIHKAEYFLNARIVGSKVNAKPWELLTAILVMETLFGMAGVVAAPVFYAYLKKELSDQQLV